ncbi:hypothetical protein BV898_13321 [Hypsibius exemplaris]|uniref:Uncharacterized protein n=1 Tax=Hypsibius exemplaris TaxID=2072580 RepID=A0A1W0WB45_HYPEX|nr:hypothetical protein BV898_13321 [Hypsibius exemplaris]
MATRSRVGGREPRVSKSGSYASGVLGVVGSSRDMPLFGVQLADPDEFQGDGTVVSLDALDEDVEEAGKKFLFATDEGKLLTSVRRNGSKGAPHIILHGILRIQKRLVQSSISHDCPVDNSAASTSSPLKGTLSTRNFLVPFDVKLEKSSYEKPKHVAGDDAATISFMSNDPVMWREFVTTALSNFEDKLLDSPETIQNYWSRVGLQQLNRSQEDDVFVWNGQVAHVFDNSTKKFVRVPLEKAGYFSRSMVNFTPVTMCLKAPEYSVVEELIASIGIMNAVTFFCFVGQGMISCRPRFVIDRLQRNIPSVIVVGRSDSGKTFFVQLALTPFGSDRTSGRAFSWNKMSAYEFGKKAEKNTTPLLISDPPKDDAMQYAEVVQNVFDGDRVQTRGLTYDPGAGPVLCVNRDYLRKWQKREQEEWDRIRTRLVVFEINGPVPFPDEDDLFYQKAQCLSSHLGELLYFPEDDLRASMKHFKDQSAAVFHEQTTENDHSRKSIMKN